MFRILLFVILIQAAYSGEPASRLYDSWKSDAAATNAYLGKHANLNEMQKRIFSDFFGKSVITFRPDGSGFIELASNSFTMEDGRVRELPASKTDFTFKILDEAESQIVIRTTFAEGIFTDHPFAILKLHDADTYSVSLSDGFAEINGREFFKRLEAPAPPIGEE
ncbi:hypothetical protein [Luteolibacter sp. AS25]|uniref:hypothetical protein n=1 Tax=Luteolibacter sp. AS25 TaxID=3135776 RepID=UPI00398A8E31